MADDLEALNTPVITDYSLFLLIREVYKSGKGLYLRTDVAHKKDEVRLRNALLASRILDRDSDYSRLYRISSIPDRPADEIACLVDPYCYLSHLSALQRYGFTDRRPNELIITTASPKLGRELLYTQVQKDLGDDSNSPDVIRPVLVRHPKKVRKRPILTVRSSKLGQAINVRGTAARVSSIGQVFLDTLERPDLCGGMSHVLEVWQRHAEEYLEIIIETLGNDGSPIVLVRAGYILNELLNINDARIEAWRRFAQRGGSRRLDPSKPYIPRWSDRWEISINV